jgi:hypothetical protein
MPRAGVPAHDTRIESGECSVRLYMPPAGKVILGTVATSDRVQSNVRPFGAAHMTAGPDEIRGSDPNQNRALESLDNTRCVPFSNRPHRHHLLGTRTVSWSWSRHGAAAGLFSSWHGDLWPAIGLATQEHGPGDARHLVRQHDRDQAGRAMSQNLL